MRKISLLIALLKLITLYGVASTHEEDVLNGDLRLAGPLTDNMVIQQNKPFKVCGYTKAHQEVTITPDWAATAVVIRADDKGYFTGIIDVPAVSPGDFTTHGLVVTSDDAQLRLKNLLIGDVWFFSGQSNMQFAMDGLVNAKTEIAAANFPNIRIFNAGLNFSNTPLDKIHGHWQACSPETVEKFSAVAYYFGRELHTTLNIPIGIIFSGIGASAAQAYVPKDVLAADPFLDSAYLQPYLKSKKSKEVIDGGFTFEKVTRPYLLYNAMIHPFINLSITGIGWYQGESNRHERHGYTHLMHSLISSWRKNFGQGSLPFYYVQVAPFFYDKEDPVLADYAFFREAQEKISQLSNTAMVVTMDVGESKDLHPKNKKPIGIRLAKIALNRTYGLLDVAYRGPQYQSVLFKRNKAVISFLPGTLEGGLKTRDGRAPAHFFMAGKDKVFHPAEAKIEGNTIVLTAKVKHPVAVRYAFTNYPITNLENGAGFPAVPFRTDRWPEEEE